MGHDVRLIAAQHVSRRVVGNKNDYRDAQVITELRGNPQMPFVPINTEAQQDIQLLHRVRERLVTHRTALMLQIRGLLGEYGAVFAPGVRPLRQGLVEVLGGEHLSLSASALETFSDLGYPPWERVQVIVNRYHKKSGITRKEAEEGIDRKISWLIRPRHSASAHPVNTSMSHA